jgi:tRNA(Ile2) C34 agmatinyltransferase TiaS
MVMPYERLKILEHCERFCPTCGRVLEWRGSSLRCEKCVLARFEHERPLESRP